MIPKFLLEAVDSVINKPEVKDIPVADISHHHELPESKDIPVADISHHHDKNLTEGALHTWLNKTHPDFKVNKFHTVHDPILWSAIRDSHEELSNKQNENLTPIDRGNINTYIEGGLLSGDSTGSKRINEHLIESHKRGTKIDHQFEFDDEDGDGENTRYLNLHHLDAALAKNKLEKPLTTYSGLGFNPKDSIKSDGLLHLPAYTSSSTNRGVATRYTKKQGVVIHEDGKVRGHEYHLLQIQHPKGSTGMYVGDNKDLSPFSQKEHISPRGMTIKVDPTPDIHTDADGNKLHVWKAKRLLSYEK